MSGQARAVIEAPPQRRVENDLQDRAYLAQMFFIISEIYMPCGRRQRRAGNPRYITVAEPRFVRR